MSDFSSEEQGYWSYKVGAAECEYERAKELKRPFMLLRPRICRDGNQWCVLYGENLHDGVCGFGDTPEKASLDFDKNWQNQQLNLEPPQ